MVLGPFRTLLLSLLISLAGFAGINDPDSKGFTALDYAVFHTKADDLAKLLQDPELTGLDSALATLIVSCDTAEGEKLSALHDCIKLILESRQDIDINGVKSELAAPLMLAVNSNDAECVRLLLAYKGTETVDVNQVAEDATPLFLAIGAYDEEKEGEQALDVLLADPRIDAYSDQFCKGLTPWHFALIDQRIGALNALYKNGYRPRPGKQFENDLLLAMRLELEPAIAALIAMPDIDCASPSSAGVTPLQIAVADANGELVAGLLARSDVQINAATKAIGETALTLAIKSGNNDIIEKLLAHPDCDVNLAERSGTTPLIWAAKMRNSKAICMLLEKGAKKDAVTQDGSTALSVAQALDEECAKILEDKVALTPKESIFTVFVYGCGSDLESKWSCLSDDMTEMCDGQGAGDAVRVVVLYGGCAQLKKGRSLGDIFEIDSEGEKKIGSFGPCDMGHPNTLTHFLEWGFANYKAQRYGLVLWNHGGGPAWGLCLDENTRNHISLPGLKQALDAAGVANKERHFSFIALDVCLMAHFETVAALAQHCEMVWASQQVVPGSGLDYSAWLEALNSNPSMHMHDLAKVALDSFLEDAPAQSEGVTYSAVDTREFLAVVQEVQSYLGKVDSALDLATTMKAMSTAEGYLYGQDSKLMDLRSFLWVLQQLSGISVPTSLPAAFNRALIHKVSTQPTDYCCGLSLYVPLPPVSMDTRSAYVQLLEACMPGPWSNLVRKMSYVLDYPPCEVSPVVLVRGLGWLPLQPVTGEARSWQVELSYKDKAAVQVDLRTSLDSLSSYRVDLEVPTSDGKAFYIASSRFITKQEEFLSGLGQGGFSVTLPREQGLSLNKADGTELPLYVRITSNGWFLYGRLDGVDGCLNLYGGNKMFWPTTAQDPFTVPSTARPVALKAGQLFAPRTRGAYNPDGSSASENPFGEAFDPQTARIGNRFTRDLTQFNLRITYTDILGRQGDTVLCKVTRPKP